MRGKRRREVRLGTSTLKKVSPNNWQDILTNTLPGTREGQFLIQLYGPKGRHYEDPRVVQMIAAGHTQFGVTNHLLSFLRHLDLTFKRDIVGAYLMPSPMHTLY